MKSLTALWQEAALELAAWCDTSTTRDVETLRARVDHEGVSFLTITLPAFCSDFEKSLEQGAVGSNLFTGFRSRGGLPLFLRGFLRRIFDEQSGFLLYDPCVDSIFAIRQLTLMFKKIELPCTPEREQAARESYVSCEKELKQLDSEWTRVSDPEFSRISLLVFGDALDAVNREVDSFQLSPAHGPGATADGKRGNQKYVQTEWPERLEAVFPYGEYVLPNWRHYDASSITFLKPTEERPVKVRFVPKTLKTPRVIAVEPTCMQYMQQALMRSLVPKLEGMTSSSGFVGFTDQEPNQLMACQGSRDGTLATLDLSEASDRVLNSVVLDLLRPWPSLSEAVQACRTRTAELDTGQRIRLSKFASMGSALTFPMEAMVFATLVFMGIQDARRIRLSRRDIQSLRGSVRVFGDDIIVPVDCVSAVTARLEAYGLKVNRHKSFWSGKFRESCGGDFYDGWDVKPIRVKQKPPNSRRDATELMAWVQMSNAFHKRGMWKTARRASLEVEKVLGPLPCVPHQSAGLGLHSFVGSTSDRWDHKLHRPMVRAWVPKNQPPKSELDGIFALRKTLDGDWSDPAYRDHLKRSGRPLVVSIKRGWVPAH